MQDGREVEKKANAGYIILQIQFFYREFENIMSEDKSRTCANDDGLIFPTGVYKGVPYFKPPVGFDEESALARRKAANLLAAEEAAELLPGIPELKMPITVSFIYAHPADYYGKPMLNADVGEWKNNFRRFKSMNIDTVIFQAALWRELKECYYCSSNFPDLKCFKVVENMLQAAEEENMRVYMGGYGSVVGWGPGMTIEDLKREAGEHRKCFDELSRIGKFDGMYFPAETCFRDKRLPEREFRMNYLYRSFSGMVKEKYPEMKVIVSPATGHETENNGLFCEFWNAILEKSGVDVLMPQDSIGTGLSRISQMSGQWKAWKSVADDRKLKLWSHTEIFERRGYRPEDNLYPAAAERVAVQLALTEPYVERHCCWEALSFATDERGEPGRALRSFMSILKIKNNPPPSFA